MRIVLHVTEATHLKATRIKLCRVSSIAACGLCLCVHVCVRVCVFLTEEVRLLCLTRFKVWLVWNSQLSRLGCLVFLQVVLPISILSIYFRPFTI